MFYEFVGEWLPIDKFIIETALAPHLPTKPKSAFNTWRFYCGGNSFSAVRASWTQGFLRGTTSTELANALTNYYAKIYE